MSNTNTGLGPSNTAKTAALAFNRLLMAILDRERAISPLPVSTRTENSSVNSASPSPPGAASDQASCGSSFAPTPSCDENSLAKSPCLASSRSRGLSTVNYDRHPSAITVDKQAAAPASVERFGFPHSTSPQVNGWRAVNHIPVTSSDKEEMVGTSPGSSIPQNLDRHTKSKRGEHHACCFDASSADPHDSSGHSEPTKTPESSSSAEVIDSVENVEANFGTLRHDSDIDGYDPNDSTINHRCLYRLFTGVPCRTPQGQEGHYRKGFSDLFGRNKAATARIKNWIEFCRPHYQRQSYAGDGEPWQQQRLNLVIEQFKRIMAQEPRVTFTIMLKRGELDRLSAWNNANAGNSTALKDSEYTKEYIPQSTKKTSKKGNAKPQSDEVKHYMAPLSVLQALHGHSGRRKSYLECLLCLRDIEGMFHRGDIHRMPNIEFVPEWVTPNEDEDEDMQEVPSPEVKAPVTALATPITTHEKGKAKAMYPSTTAKRKGLSRPTGVPATPTSAKARAASVKPPVTPISTKGRFSMKGAVQKPRK